MRKTHPERRQMSNDRKVQDMVHNDDPRQILDSMTVSDLSDSGDWLPSPEPNYRPKLFDEF